MRPHTKLNQYSAWRSNLLYFEWQLNYMEKTLTSHTSDEQKIVKTIISGNRVEYHQRSSLPHVANVIELSEVQNIRLSHLDRISTTLTRNSRTYQKPNIPSPHLNTANLNWIITFCKTTFPNPLFKIVNNDNWYMSTYSNCIISQWMNVQQFTIDGRVVSDPFPQGKLIRTVIPSVCLGSPCPSSQYCRPVISAVYIPNNVVGDETDTR